VLHSFPCVTSVLQSTKTPERQWNYMLQNSTGMLHVYEPHLLHVWVCTLPSLVPSCVTTQHAQPPSWFFTSFGASFNTTSCTKHNIKENNTKTKQKKPKYSSLRTIKILHALVLMQKFSMALFTYNWHFNLDVSKYTWNLIVGQVHILPYHVYVGHAENKNAKIKMTFVNT